MQRWAVILQEHRTCVCVCVCVCVRQRICDTDRLGIHVILYVVYLFMVYVITSVVQIILRKMIG
jgi:hypothetical protein